MVQSYCYKDGLLLHLFHMSSNLCRPYSRAGVLQAAREKQLRLSSLMLSSIKVDLLLRLLHFFCTSMSVFVDEGVTDGTGPTAVGGSGVDRRGERFIIGGSSAHLFGEGLSVFWIYVSNTDISDCDSCGK